MIRLKRTLLFVLAFALASCNAPKGPEYHVAAYIWPSCHNDPVGEEILWEEGQGEWQVIRRGDPRFEGHYQPKRPLWGYEMDDDPEVMEKWIDLATSHGIDTFVFDWYWFDSHPFLEGCLNDGFLKARNNGKMNFCCMWANHNVARNYWNCHRYGDDDSRLWSGAVSDDDYKAIVERVIRQYFHLPNYLKIDGRPVFSVFSLGLFMESFGGDAVRAREAVDYFRAKVKEAGFPDLYLQFMVQGKPEEVPVLEAIGADGTSQYGFQATRTEDYLEWSAKGLETMRDWAEIWKGDFFPSVSIGYDDSPRFPNKNIKRIVHLNRTPENFAKNLQAAKEFCAANPEKTRRFINIYAFNEWVEDSYLLPDEVYGFEYVETVKKVMSE